MNSRFKNGRAFQKRARKFKKEPGNRLTDRSEWGNTRPTHKTMPSTALVRTFDRAFMANPYYRGAKRARTAYTYARRYGPIAIKAGKRIWKAYKRYRGRRKRSKIPSQRKIGGTSLTTWSSFLPGTLYEFQLFAVDRGTQGDERMRQFILTKGVKLCLDFANPQTGTQCTAHVRWMIAAPKDPGHAHATYPMFTNMAWDVNFPNYLQPFDTYGGVTSGAPNFSRICAPVSKTAMKIYAGGKLKVLPAATTTTNSRYEVALQRWCPIKTKIRFADATAINDFPDIRLYVWIENMSNDPSFNLNYRMKHISYYRTLF